MDEGKAALYAAIIGFAAAIIGAAVGGWASWRAARHSADAAIRAAVEQVKGQAKNEHAHWIRQERLHVYRIVLQACTDFMTAVHQFETRVRAGRNADELHQLLDQRLRDVELSTSSLHLLGPSAVHAAALRLLAEVDSTVGALRGWEHLRNNTEAAHDLRCRKALATQAALAFTDECWSVVGTAGD
ncbi:hypothetical protein [Streptomyces inhibens]|uniref:hypothetical protein n=1 Tax=Streptomyces inhibens TaxID=2293571 RepID=UPI001EE75AB4|nr:hypothetical protein [Streptomyces inhibens]UKY54274.1 hypothetical protein KI385_39325 [Streptomyces inhibens]